MSAGLDASSRHLLGRLGIVEARVALTVARRRSNDPDPDDRFRGLYISEAQVDALLGGGGAAAVSPPPPDPGAAERLAGVEAGADAAEAGGASIRLRCLARSFALDHLDVELLLIALAPDLDPRFERLYAYLHDDVSRRRASTGLALELCGAALGAARGRSRLGPAGPLVSAGIVLVEELNRPFLTRSLRVPDRVTAHLLGDDTPDPVVASVATASVEVPIGPVASLERALRAGVGLTYVRERVGATGMALGTTALSRAGLPPLTLDLHRLVGAAPDEIKDLAAAADREAGLRGGGLVAGPVECLADHGAVAVRSFAETRCPMVLVGARGWDPTWSRQVPLLLDAPVPTGPERTAVWREALDGDAPAEIDPAAATAQFRLTPEQVHRAAEAARQQATAEGRTIAGADLQTGARAQNAAGLERLARRIEPRAGWEDLVLPAAILAQLVELVARIRHRERVLDEWGMGRRTSKGRGITALFAGDSGTGKTLSAEVVARSLGLDLYVIDLSTVVDKYIGETEKNLDRIFAEADRVNGVLLFDEADAIFGKRSDVKDAHDRYANVEVAYLLQRMELFDGLAILTTNLRANLDEAFTRRLDAIVDFPMPEEDDRRRLWEGHLRADLPLTQDIDIGFLARAFRISGGNIRNIALAAAYLAAAADHTVGMAELIRGTVGEYHKLGHLCVESEFGRYYALVNEGT